MTQDEMEFLGLVAARLIGKYITLIRLDSFFLSKTIFARRPQVFDGLMKVSDVKIRENENDLIFEIRYQSLISLAIESLYPEEKSKEMVLSSRQERTLDNVALLDEFLAGRKNLSCMTATPAPYSVHVLSNEEFDSAHQLMGRTLAIFYK